MFHSSRRRFATRFDQASGVEPFKQGLRESLSMKMSHTVILVMLVFASACSRPASQPAVTLSDSTPSGSSTKDASDEKSYACLIDGAFNLMGKTIKAKDCMQAAPKEDESAFKTSCEQLANALAMMGGKPGVITYMEHCTRPAQGVCRNFIRTGRDAYYYARSPEDLRDLPSDCAKGGGSWDNGS